MSLGVMYWSVEYQGHSIVLGVMFYFSVENKDHINFWSDVLICLGWDVFLNRLSGS